MTRFLAFLILFPLLWLPFQETVSAQSAEDDIALQIRPGVSGWYRSGQIVPIQVNLSSGETSLRGYVQVRVDRASGAAIDAETVYRTPITLSAGDSRLVFLYATLNDFTTQVEVELVNEEGEVILRQSETVRQINRPDLLYAVVSDSTGGFINIARESIGRGQQYQANWDIRDIPRNADALQALDVLVFHDINTERLETEQIEAIGDWVAGGGHLIVTGGPGWQRTTEALTTLLPTEPESTETLDNTAAIGEYIGITFDENADAPAPTIIADNTPAEGAQVLLQAGGIPLIVRGSLGAGTVDFLAFDPNTEPLNGWDETDILWRELIMSASPRPGWSYGVQNFSRISDAVSNVTGFDLPGALQLTLFLLAYIALIGPLNYIALNALKRRELAWVTIPIIIIVFTIGAYLTGFSIRGDAVTVNQLTVVQVWEDYDRARVDGAIGVLSPRRATYDVLIDEDISLRTIPNVTGTSSISQVNITQGLSQSADEIPVDAAIMANFSTSGYIPAPDFDGQATWILRGEATARIEGQVVNGLDTALEDAVILADDEFFNLGDLAAGETAQFGFNVGLGRFARLPIGNLADPTRYNNFNPAAVANFDPGQLCAFVRSTDVLYYNLVEQWDEFACTGGDNADRRLRRRALMIAAVLNEIDHNSGRGSSVYLVGWGDNPPIGVEVSGRSQLEDGNVMYIYEIPTTYTNLNDSRVVIPPGMMSWTVIERDVPNRLPDVNYDNEFSFILNSEQGMALRFAPLPNAPITTVEEIEISFDWRLTTDDLQFSMWNWDTGEWQAVEMEDLTARNFTLSIDNPAFVGPQNTFQILFAVGESTAQQSVNNLSILLRGTRD